MPNSLSELTRHTCLVGNGDEWYFTLDGRPHSVRVHGLLQCNSGHALLDAALKGIGIIQLPDYYVSDHLARGELIELLPELRAPEEGIWALYPHNRHLSPRYGCWWTIWPNVSAILTNPPWFARLAECAGGMERT